MISDDINTVKLNQRLGPLSRKENLPQNMFSDNTDGQHRSKNDGK